MLRRGGIEVESGGEYIDGQDLCNEIYKSYGFVKDREPRNIN